LCADAFQDCEPAEHSEEEQCATEQVFMLLSSAAMTGAVSPRTLQLKGVLVGQDLLILVEAATRFTAPRLLLPCPIYRSCLLPCL
jgi:hypothetical protein